MHLYVCVCRQPTILPLITIFFLTIGNVHFKHLSVNIYKEMAKYNIDINVS